MVCLLLLLYVACPQLGIASTDARQTVIVVRGAEGEPEFGRQFVEWSKRWEAAAQQADARLVLIGNSPGEKSDKELLEVALSQEATVSTDTLWLVLIGHGTFDGKSAKFNLVGPDVAEVELAKWLKTVTRPLVVLNCSSCSSPFLNALSGPNRVVITATKSGHERNFARLGDYLSSAMTDLAADLDKDDQVSILEAYLTAGYQVTQFYEEQARLATEHALLDDNGDRLGTPADWFTGTRATKSAKDGAAVDGLRANQLCLIRSESERRLSTEVRQRRDELELRLGQLRGAKASMDESEYYDKLEVIALELAKLYAADGKQTTDQH